MFIIYIYIYINYFIIYTFDRITNIKTIFTYIFFFKLLLLYLPSNIFFNCIYKITIMIQNHKMNESFKTKSN